MTDPDTSPRNITTDHETIREWVDQRGGTPARMGGAVEDDASSLYIVREDEEMADLEPISWEDFFETFEDEGLAFVYQDQDVGETDEWLYDIVDRDEIADRASLERTEVEEKLLEGEVVRSEITETKVIEKTVVETEAIESEVVDSEIIERTPVDRETISREIIAGEFEAAPSGLVTTLSPVQEDTATDPETEVADTGPETETAATETDVQTRPDVGTVESDMDIRTESDEKTTETVDEPGGETAGEPAAARETTQSTDGLAVADGVVLDVQDTVLTTTEVFDRKTVESRVVERDISEEDVVESDAIDIEGVEETILESDLIEGELVGSETEPSRREAIPSGAITSEQTGGDAVRSQFVERRLIETEATEYHRISCDITNHELADTIDSRSNIIERAIVDREAGEEAMLREPEAGVRTTDEQLSAADQSATTPEADAELAAEPGGETGEAGMVDEDTETGMAGEETETGMAGEDTETGADEAAKGILPSEDDIGKTVVSSGDEIGMVSDVEDERLYVDPDPTFTDRIKASLDWGDTDDDTYPVEHEQIEEITDDEVRIVEL